MSLCDLFLLIDIDFIYFKIVQISSNQQNSLLTLLLSQAWTQSSRSIRTSFLMRNFVTSLTFKLNYTDSYNINSLITFTNVCFSNIISKLWKIKGNFEIYVKLATK